MASKHNRKVSTRAPLTRKITNDDPLSSTVTPIITPPRSSLASPASSMPETDPDSSSQQSALPSPSLAIETSNEQDVNAKDLSFLLDPSIYHPLSQLDFPAPFRVSLPSRPSSSTPVSQSLSRLDGFLAKADFLSAAHFAAGVLSSGALRPTDSKTIFRLLSTRFSCLELTGNTLLAAQESKALEDLISTFYYYDAPDTFKKAEGEMAPPEHVMPFSLRLQALRLQSIGFSDPRRGVGALYDLGIECREHVAFSGTSEQDRQLWRARLEEIGARVTNSLIEMGDLDCARRTLEATIVDVSEIETEVAQRMALLYLKCGDLRKAQALQGASNFLEPLLATAEGRYDDAAKLWENQLEAEPTGHVISLIKQNLAVAYLYSGRIAQSRNVLRELVEHGQSFESLTVNLATLYELSSDRSKDLKIAAAGQIAQLQKDRGVLTPMTNGAFKL